MMRPRHLNGLLIGVLLVFIAASMSGRSDLVAWLGSPLQGLVLLVAAALAFGVGHALREVPEAARHWFFFASGLLLFGAGEVWDAVYELPGATRPIPAPPDLLYLAGYVLMPVALIGFLRTYRSLFPVSTARELWLSALAVGAVLTALGAFLVRPVLDRPLPLPEKIYLIAYSLLDVGLLAPLALLVRTVYAFRGGPVARAWGVLLTGFLVMAMADLLFGLTPLIEGTWISGLDEIVYLAAYLLQLKGLALHRELVS